MADTKKLETTKAGSHVAVRRGYATGLLIEEGEAVPAGVVVSEEWMEPAKKAKADKADAE